MPAIHYLCLAGQASRRGVRQLGGCIAVSLGSCVPYGGSSLSDLASLGYLACEDASILTRAHRPGFGFVLTKVAALEFMCRSAIQFMSTLRIYFHIIRERLYSKSD